MTRPAGLGLTQVCIAGVLWGTGGLAVHVLHERVGMSAVVASAWRMGLAAAVLLAAVLVLGSVRDVRRLVTEVPIGTLVVGVSTALYQGLYFVAVLSVGVGVATVVSLGLAPVLVAGWEGLRARRVPSGRRFAVLGAALTGLILVTGAGVGAGTGPRPVLGVVAAVAAAFGYAATTLVGRTLSRRTTPLALTTAATAVGAVALLPAAAWTGAGGGVLVTDDLASLALLVWLGVATMALAYGLLYAGLRTTSGTAATIATLLEPVTAAVLAAVLLEERLGAGGVLGAVLILLAVAGQPAERREVEEELVPPRP